MEVLEILKKFGGQERRDYPEIGYSNLYKKVYDNLYFEFIDEKAGGLLFSPLYTFLRGEKSTDFTEFVGQNETLLDSFKKYVINSLFVYSALIDENSYYLTKPQSIMMMRILPKQESDLELKFYTHYQDELIESYNDKIYLGRDFINLEHFSREYLGINKVFISLAEQGKKTQEKARHKLRYYADFKKPYLDELDYLSDELLSEARERIKIFPYATVAQIPKVKLDDVLDSIFYLQNLMVELKDFLYEFENKLRLGEENNFVKHLVKFSKDLKNDIRYLRKLSYLIHLKIANFPI